MANCLVEDANFQLLN